MSRISFPEAYLPAFTRAAFWWLMIIGLLHLLAAAYSFLTAFWGDGAWIVFWVVLPLAAGSLSSAILLCVKKRSAWITSVAILSITLIFVIALSVVYSYPGFGGLALEMVYVVGIFLPLMAVILNRPKYTAMLRKMDLADSTTTAVEP